MLERDNEVMQGRSNRARHVALIRPPLCTRESLSSRYEKRIQTLDIT
jgi:hypothetical protein